MQDTAKIQKKVLITLKKLPIEKQQEVLDFAALLRSQIAPKKRRSRQGEAKINMNDERKHNARNRITQAIAYLEKEHGELPCQIGARIELLRTTTKELFGIGISNSTLKKPDNLPLWHPKHQLTEPSEETIFPAPDRESGVVQEASPTPN